MSEALQEYFNALERLKKRKAKINNDTVAIEAGRKKGSIKKSRPIFHDLILAIDAASASLAAPRDQVGERLSREKENAQYLKSQLEAALARELSLLRELYAVKKQLAKLTGANVLPIRGMTSTDKD